MKKRIALLVYPDFSLQEVTNLMYFFRWAFDTFTDLYIQTCVLLGVKKEL